MNGLINKEIGSINIVNTDDRIVEGYFTDDKVDYVGHVIDMNATLEALKDYGNWGNIRDMHGEPVAVVIEIGKKAWNHVMVKVHDDNTWKKIKTGVYKGFSVGINPIEWDFVPMQFILAKTPDALEGLPEAIVDLFTKIGEIIYITKYMLVEISVVDRPANPRAQIMSYKSMGANGALVHPKIQEYYMEESKMSEALEQKEQEVEVEQVENDADFQEAEETKDVEAEVVEEQVDQVEDEVDNDADFNKVIDLVTKLNDSIDSLMDSYDGKIEDIEKRLVALETPAQDTAHEDAEETEVAEEKAEDAVEEKGAESKLDAILNRLEKALEKAERDRSPDRAGVNKETDVETDFSKPEASYKSIAENIAKTIR